MVSNSDPGNKSRTPATTPGMSNRARDFDQDRPIWERQAEESDEQFGAFYAYLMQPKRKISDHGPTAYKWSAMWSWQARVFEWDNHAIRSELALQERLRIEMNDRHRTVARVGLGKVGQWLQGLDATRMTVSEGTRLLEIVSRLEQQANGGSAPTRPKDELDIPPGDEPTGVQHEGTFAERVAGADLGVELRDLAKFLHHRIPPTT